MSKATPAICEHQRVAPHPLYRATWVCADCGAEADTPDWDNLSLRVGKQPGEQAIEPGRWDDVAPDWSPPPPRRP